MRKKIVIKDIFGVNGNILKASASKKKGRETENEKQKEQDIEIQ